MIPPADIPLMTAGDRLVIVLAAILIAVLYAGLWRPSAAPAAVEYLAAGESGRLDLHPDRVVDLDGPLGTSRVQFADRGVRFIESPCDGKQCLHSGWLRRGGDFAACLPNRVALTVVAADRGYDAINY